MGVVEGTRIQTDHGCLRVEELAGLDLRRSPVQLAGRFQTAKLKEVSPLGQQAVLRLCTTRGHCLDALREHRFLAMDKQGNLCLRKLSNLRPGDWICRQGVEGLFGNVTELPTVAVKARTNYKPFPMPRKLDTDWASFLGLHLAESSLTLSRNGRECDGFQLCLAHEKDPELPTKTAALLRRIFGSRLSTMTIRYDEDQDQTRFAVASRDVGAWLSMYVPGNAHSKFVPEFVFRAPRDLQAAFLCWLFAHDGSVKKDHKSYSIGYSTASARLAKDVVILLANFGITATVSSERRVGYDGTYWAIQLHSNASRQKFAHEIGFATAAATTISTRQAGYNRDSRAIPHQARRLASLLPNVPGAVKEKCRECTRVNKRVWLNPSRLELILNSVDRAELTISAAANFDYLRHLLEWPLNFEEVAAVQSVGRQSTYAVHPVGHFRDVTFYDAFLGRCSQVDLKLPIYR